MSPLPTRQVVDVRLLKYDEAVPPAARARVSLADLFGLHYDSVWQTLRRLGLPPHAADDAAQEVFLVAARKVDAIEPGHERAFLYGVAIRLAADARKALGRRRETSGEEAISSLQSSLPAPDLLTEQKRARELLDALLSRLPFDLRTAFVLFEIEELTTAEIASSLQIPIGTVASRLRRAREEFQALVRRIETREGSK